MDAILFGALPYAVATATVVGALRRFGQQRDTVTSASSQLLEGRLQYWGSVPWHYGILTVLLAHLVAILFPNAVAALLSSPGRLVAVEVTGFAFGVTALWGLVVLGLRRLTLRGRTTWIDWTVMALLLFQVATGLWVALTARWGLAWFVHVASPWLASLALLSPRPDLMAPLPWPVKLHALNALLLVALVPYTRLAHIFAAPVEFLWRVPQVVIWRRPRSSRPEVSP
jgi:nitrate reductase gamma subunit